jgi:transcriptional regulator with XRE-family HTH domain
MAPDSHSIGNSLRRLRVERHLSLATVAGQAGISVATLSRVETGKQNVDVALLMTLSRILGVAPGEMLGADEQNDDLGELSRRVSRLPPAERARVFAEASRRRATRDISTTMDDLLMQVDLIRDELVDLQRWVGARKR